MTIDEAAQIRQLLSREPDLEYFYLVTLTYTTGATGDNVYYGLLTDASQCRSIVPQLCAAQQRRWQTEVDALTHLPPEEEPYDPYLPDGCTVSLCIVVHSRRQYILIHRQHWNNQGRTHQPSEAPDIFVVDYYRQKVASGDYTHFQVRNLDHAND